jgi:hypothetical protein
MSIARRKKAADRTPEEAELAKRYGREYAESQRRRNGVPVMVASIVSVARGKRAADRTVDESEALRKDNRARHERNYVPHPRQPSPLTAALYKAAVDRTPEETEMVRSATREYRDRNRAEFNVNANKYYHANKKAILARARSDGYRFRTYRRGAKKRGIPFKLTLELFVHLRRLPCFYCSRATGGIGGVDRVDSEAGYVPGNVVACCAQCNIAKMDYSVSEFVEMCTLVAKRFHGIGDASFEQSLHGDTDNRLEDSFFSSLAGACSGGGQLLPDVRLPGVGGALEND